MFVSSANSAIATSLRGKSSPGPLQGHKIMIDPGHGGRDPGAIGQTGLQEKAVVLDVSLELARQLREWGAEVRLTRETDRQVAGPDAPKREDLQARVDLANNWPAEIFISMHANANNNRDVKGTESYVARNSSEASKKLAAAVHRHMVDDLGLPDRRVLKSDFFVIKNTRMPGMLMEIAYLSNTEEEAKLADPSFRQRAATAMAAGVKDYFTQPAAGEPLPEPGEPEFQPDPDELDGYVPELFLAR
jgi:N-acetylmuramoyl-L-alanine amidase